MSQTTETKTKTPVERLEEWIAALRSGKYQQGYGQLREFDSYCCLGVACDLYDATGWESVRDGLFRQQDGALMPRVVKKAYRITDRDVGMLINRNDGEHLNFAALADYIESTILPRVRREQEGR